MFLLRPVFSQFLLTFFRLEGFFSSYFQLLCVTILAPSRFIWISINPSNCRERYLIFFNSPHRSKLSIRSEGRIEKIIDGGERNQMSDAKHPISFFKLRTRTAVCFPSFFSELNIMSLLKIFELRHMVEISGKASASLV